MIKDQTIVRRFNTTDGSFQAEFMRRLDDGRFDWTAERAEAWVFDTYIEAERAAALNEFTDDAGKLHRGMLVVIGAAEQAERDQARKTREAKAALVLEASIEDLRAGPGKTMQQRIAHGRKCAASRRRRRPALAPEEAFARLEARHLA